MGREGLRREDFSRKAHYRYSEASRVLVRAHALCRLWSEIPGRMGGSRDKELVMLTWATRPEDLCVLLGGKPLLLLSTQHGAWLPSGLICGVKA